MPAESWYFYLDVHQERRLWWELNSTWNSQAQLDTYSFKLFNISAKGKYLVLNFVKIKLCVQVE